jgi:polysaccharide deacetylase family protein (PEP-CTERM system associated)
MSSLTAAENSQSAILTNAFTVDLEDWPVAVLGPDQAISDRVVRNTLDLLRILRQHNVQATFFVLTRVAEKFPDLIREVHAAGHEIASHGHGHQLLTKMTPREFREDVQTSIDILTELTGERPIGYRAPAFSIVRQTLWAGPILAELGFTYSSSIFPIRHRRYGIPSAPRGIHRWPDCDLIECPPATIRFCGVNFPFAGGGYFRLLPGRTIRMSIDRVHAEGMPSILYMHPYELDRDGIANHVQSGVKVGLARRVSQTLGRKYMHNRLSGLLENYEFMPLTELLADRGWLKRSASGQLGAFDKCLNVSSID